MALWYGKEPTLAVGLTRETLANRKPQNENNFVERGSSWRLISDSSIFLHIHSFEMFHFLVFLPDFHHSIRYSMGIHG